MMLYKAEQCAPCKKLANYIEEKGIVVPTTTLTFDKLREGNLPFRTVPSLLLDDGEVISGFPKIRLFLSRKEK